MSSTTFSAGTVIPVDWLNEVNALLWGSASPPATPIRVATNGNVGFGNANANAGIAVRIRRDSTVATESDVALRIDTSEAAGGVGLGFGVNSASGIGYIQTVEPGTTYSSKSLVLQPNDGNVGIGVTPTYRLSVTAPADPATTPTARFGSASNRPLYFQPGTGGSAIFGPVIGFGAYANTTVGNYIQPTSISMTGGALITGPYAGGLDFYTYNAGAETGTTQTLSSTLRLRLSATGDLTSSGGLIGYGTGAGGTVTQATSKSTNVTLNTSSGQITMHNASLAAGTSVTFGVVNSKVSASDVVIVSSGAFGTNYRVEVFGVTSARFDIRVTNLSGSPLSEALIINFAVIKGSTS